MAGKARKKLTNIKQGDRSANQLLVDILELYEVAEYTTDSGEFVIETLLNALKDPEVKAHYIYSKLKTKLTVSQIVQYANVIAEAKQEQRQATPAHSVHKVEDENVSHCECVNKVYGYGRGKKFGKKKQEFKPAFKGKNKASKCTGCGSFDHEYRDKSCWALGKKCNKCGLMDHLSRMCFTKKRKQFGKGYRNKKIYEESDSESDSKEQNETAVLLANSIFF